jgi:hypothetical protein
MVGVSRSLTPRSATDAIGSVKRMTAEGRAGGDEWCAGCGLG